MTIISDAAQDVIPGRAKLDQLAAEIEAISTARSNLLLDIAAKLEVGGYEATIARHYRSWPLRVGAVVGVLEEFSRWGDDAPTAHRIETIGNTSTGVHTYSFTMHRDPLLNVGLVIHHGPHRVMLVDGRDVLVVKLPADDEEAGWRRSVSRLRTLARRDNVRVRVRDREVMLFDPLDNVIHVGDVVSAFAWLLNMEPRQRRGVSRQSAEKDGMRMHREG